MEQCVLFDKRRVDDGYGGYREEYIEGVTFMSAITFDTSIEARRAEAEGVTSRYTVTTKREMTLEYHDVFKRLKDGKIFRVTSDGDDKYTPQSATLDMRQCTCEEFIISGNRESISDYARG